MANGSNWDTYTEPTKRGMSIWAKVFVGCGIAGLILLISCIGLVYWAMHSGKDAIRGFVSTKVVGLVEAPWSKMVAFGQAIKTDEGALKLYEENHRLAEPYSSKEAFLKQAKVWRSALSELPADPPSIDLLSSGKFEIRQWQKNKNKFLSISYKMTDETWITLNWEDDELVGIDLR